MPEGLIKILEERPEIKVKREVSLAEQIVNEYVDAGTPDNCAVPFSGKVAKEYKNTSALARMLGKMVKKKDLENVRIAKNDNVVYILKD